MSTTSSIEWTDKTWNPVRGCSKVSAGCTNCYAMKVAHRFSGPGKPYEGLTKLVKGKGPQWTGAVRTIPDVLDAPLRWRRPSKVFVNSMSDLFHESVPFDFIDRVFAIMGLAGRHTFQILTKRPQRMAEYFACEDVGQRVAELAMAKSCRGDFDDYDEDWTADEAWNYIPAWPLPNVWLGTSVENQEAANERIPHLLRVPAAVRFLSCEPLLGPLHLTGHFLIPVEDRAVFASPIDWVIVGGESGPGARPFDVQWARDIVAACRAGGIAPFVKQLGRSWYRDEGGVRERVLPDDPKGGDMAEWPEDLRVREFPR